MSRRNEPFEQIKTEQTNKQNKRKSQYVCLCMCAISTAVPAILRSNLSETRRKSEQRLSHGRKRFLSKSRKRADNPKITRLNERGDVE